MGLRGSWRTRSGAWASCGTVGRGWSGSYRCRLVVCMLRHSLRNEEERGEGRRGQEDRTWSDTYKCSSSFESYPIELRT